MDYFELGKKITENIIKMLDNFSFESGLLVGGGLGYESTKYKDTGKTGDLDYLCIVESPQNILDIIANNKLMQKAGFDIHKSDSNYIEDIELYENEIISLVRYSGFNNGLKTGLKFITFERLIKLFSNEKSQKAYIVSHNSNNCIFIAKGTDGKDLILSSISLNISSKYQSKVEHYLWPYHNWYKNGDVLHAGAWTDFIAKGLIVKDNRASDLKKVKNKILCIMAEHADLDIVNKRQWYKMFANNKYFSESFKKQLAADIDSLIKLNKIKKRKNHKSILPDYTLLTIIPDNEDLLLVHRVSSNEHSGKISRVGNNFPTFDKLLNLGLLGKEEILHILNAEAKRLTNLFNLSINQNSTEINTTFEFSNLLLLPDDTLIPLTTTVMNADILDTLIKNTHNDFVRYKTTLNSEGPDLFSLITQLRINVIQKICELKNIDVLSKGFILDNDFLKLLKFREGINNLKIT